MIPIGCATLGMALEIAEAAPRAQGLHRWVVCMCVSAEWDGRIVAFAPLYLPDDVPVTGIGGPGFQLLQRIQAGRHC